MSDLSTERLAEWYKDALECDHQPAHRILTLIDAFQDMQKRRDAAIEQCRHLHQEGLTREEWHTKHCGAMRSLAEAQARAEQAEHAMAEIHPQSAVLYMRMSADLREEKERAENAERERDDIFAELKVITEERDQRTRDLADLRAKVGALAEEWDDTTTWQGQTDALRALLGGEDR